MNNLTSKTKEKVLNFVLKTSLERLGNESKEGNPCYTCLKKVLTAQT